MLKETDVNSENKPPGAVEKANIPEDHAQPTLSSKSMLPGPQPLGMALRNLHAQQNHWMGLVSPKVREVLCQL